MTIKVHHCQGLVPVGVLQLLSEICIKIARMRGEVFYAEKNIKGKK